MRRITFPLLLTLLVEQAMASSSNDCVVLQAEQGLLPLGMRHRHPPKVMNQPEVKTEQEFIITQQYAGEPFVQPGTPDFSAATLPESKSQIFKDFSLKEFKEHEEKFLTWLSKKSYPVNLGLIIKSLYTLVDRPIVFRNYAGSHYGAREEDHLSYLYNLAKMVKILKPYMVNDQSFNEAVKSYCHMTQNEEITFLRDIMQCCLLRRPQSVKSNSS